MKRGDPAPVSSNVSQGAGLVAGDAPRVPQASQTGRAQASSRLGGGGKRFRQAMQAVAQGLAAPAASDQRAGETIQLQSGHLDLGDSRFHPPFLADITEFGANSSITAVEAQVNPAANVREVFAMSGPTSGEVFVYQGANVAVDLRISGQSHIYASYGNAGSGAITLTPCDPGNSIPIASA